jgi:hypothetical protein
MTVPKATVDENYLPLRGENHVRPAGQVFPVKAVTVPQAMDETSHKPFWFSVLGANQAHLFASFFFGEDVHSIETKLYHLRARASRMRRD